MDQIERLIREKLMRDAQAKTRRHFIKKCAPKAWADSH